MIQKWISCSVAFWTSLVAVQSATTMSSATSGKTMIDTRAHKAVMTFGRYGPTQNVRYSGYAWDMRSDCETAEVTADGVTLVKMADEGQVAWRPARVGLHTLHHTVHGGTLTRTYDAEGPTVRIVCTRTGMAGSMLCHIDCDMPGATIYYTTDGSEPTTASCVYTGPFQATLPKVKRLLAIAVVEGYPMSQTAYPIVSVIEDVSVVSSATSGKMVVDTRAGKGPIETDHAEGITYSNLWSGDADATATVAVNGDIVKTATGEGVYRWPLPSKGGNYVLTHKTTKSVAQIGETLTATFIVASHEIEIDDGTGGSGGKNSCFSSSGVYDGQGHGIAVKVTSVVNPEIRYARAKSGPYVESLLLTNACDATAIWYTVAASGYNTYTNWATVTITPRPVTLSSKSATKVYDGTPLTAHEVAVGGDGFVAGEGAVYAFTGSQTAVGTGENTFTYTLNEKTLAGNYEITTVNGTLTVTKANIGGGEGGGDEPGDGDVSDGGLSKFDVAVVYDGEGHTVDTNALVEAFVAVIGVGETKVFYGDAAAGAAATGQEQDVGLGTGAAATGQGQDTGLGTEAAATGQGQDTGLGMDTATGQEQDAGLGTDAAATGLEQITDWREFAPVYTNAGEYVVWYRVTNPNYEDFVHAAKVTIAKRPVTLTSRSATKVYDGTPLTAHGVAVGGDGFVGGEGAVYAFTGARTAVGTSGNTFIYALNEKTLAGNYEIATVNGTLTVTKAGVETPTIASKPYNGEVQTADVPESGLYTVYANEGGRESGAYSLVLRLADAGNYRWLARDGVTVAGSFAFMTFTITKQGNAWTVEPSIGSWRTDEQARQPVARGTGR